MITTRFSDAPWFDKLKNCQIQIVGSGGIGSWLCLFLSRLQPKAIYLVDDDFVEVHNQGGQFFTSSDIGRYKVDAMHRHCINFSNYPIYTNASLFVHGNLTLPFTFSAVDDIEVRKLIYEAWLKTEERELFVDGRLTADHLVIYSVTKENEEEYAKTLFPKEEAEDLPCNFKQTSHIASMIGSLMTNVFVNYLADTEVPFMYEFSAPMFYQEKQNK